MRTTYAVKIPFILLLSFFLSQFSYAASNTTGPVKRNLVQEGNNLIAKLTEANRNSSNPIIVDDLNKLNDILTELTRIRTIAVSKLTTACATSKQALKLLHGIKFIKIKHHGRKFIKATKSYAHKLESIEYPILKSYEKKAIKEYLSKSLEYINLEVEAGHKYNKKISETVRKLKKIGVSV